MSRENLHVSYCFANLRDICVQRKGDYSKSIRAILAFASSRSDLSLSLLGAFCELFCWQQNSFYWHKAGLITCLNGRYEIVFNDFKIT